MERLQVQVRTIKCRWEYLIDTMHRFAHRASLDLMRRYLYDQVSDYALQGFWQA